MIMSVNDIDLNDELDRIYIDQEVMEQETGLFDGEAVEPDAEFESINVN